MNRLGMPLAHLQWYNNKSDVYVKSEVTYND